MDALTRLAEEASSLAKQFTAEQETLKAEVGRLKEEIRRLHDERASAIQEAVARIGRNPDTSRAMEESFEEGRRAGLAEAAVMARTYVFAKKHGQPIRLGFDPDFVPALQAWLAEHIQARSDGEEEPEREPFDPRVDGLG